MSKSKHLLAPFCFRNKKRLLGNAVQPRYATTLKRISPFRVTLQALCGTKKKAAIFSSKLSWRFLVVWSSLRPWVCSQRPRVPRDLLALGIAGKYLGVRPSLCTSKFCRLMQASRPKWQGKTCSRNLFFAWSSHVPKHLWSVRPTALRQQHVFLGFQKSLVNPRFPQGLGLSKALPLLQFPAQTRQAAAASLQLPRIHHAFQGEKPRLATDPLAPKRSMRRAGVGPSLPFQHHMAGQIESAALPRAIWRRRWSGATCAWEGTIDFSMIPASSTRFWWKDGSFKCSTLKCQSLQPVPAGKHPDRTGSSRYEYLGISGWSGPRTVRCFSAHLLSFFPAALLSQTVGNIVHAAAGMLMVWSKDPRACLPMLFRPCSCRTLARLFMLLKVSSPRIRCKRSDPFLCISSASLDIRAVVRRWTYKSRNPRMPATTFWYSREVCCRVFASSQAQATAMAAARFGKALTERYPIRTCTWPASEYQLTYGKFVCSLRPVAWNFLWLY